ncbi:hypothetical protein CPAR01_02260 [Colletotrichum paranaense]|uniref:Uncharacterized protein n=1 Tax=Colletotrichum paranaense TaxID=1914294 RepID=A0ABQ9SYZ6_9PEZI|nr:uncharacterized protein CPAR01_02260 [Colletotrichum paranaense]KAK1544758.1 hypothetical protein CPAR01_02260 [Colletotrichum paranaense]
MDFVIASYDQLGLDRPWQCSSFVADNLQCERSSKVSTRLGRPMLMVLSSERYTSCQILDITKPLGKHSVLTLIAPESLSIRA